ncbi:MAG TPA: HAD hydrolase-like protein [Natronosporangium sp.]|nr:HAD hydrolase-like protein [Natronosporangium sp.]
MARRHLVWDWNGTLLADLPVVVAATNVALASAGGGPVTVPEHRRHFRRPIVDYYAQVLGRPVDEAEFARLDKLFHDAYQAMLPGCRLTADAREAVAAWGAPQSLLSMWHHADLVPTVDRFGLTGHFVRVDGLRVRLGGGVAHKAPYLSRHLAAQRLEPATVVVIGDTVDDAHAAAAVGARCVLYSGGFTDPAQLRATGVPVVDTLLEAVDLARRL